MDGTESDTVEIKVLGAIDDMAAAEWDACAAPEAEDGGRAAEEGGHGCSGRMTGGG